jgi:hypothetical protein
MLRRVAPAPGLRGSQLRDHQQDEVVTVGHGQDDRAHVHVPEPGHVHLAPADRQLVRSIAEAATAARGPARGTAQQAVSQAASRTPIQQPTLPGNGEDQVDSDEAGTGTAGQSAGLAQAPGGD